MKNWFNEQHTFTCIQICVKIVCEGRGMNMKQIDKLCKRLERTAKGRSKLRRVSAVC